MSRHHGSRECARRTSRSRASWKSAQKRTEWVTHFSCEEHFRCRRKALPAEGRRVVRSAEVIKCDLPRARTSPSTTRSSAPGTASFMSPGLIVEHREDKGFGGSVSRLFQRGIGATRQLWRYRKLRAPDLAVVGWLAPSCSRRALATGRFGAPPRSWAIPRLSRASTSPSASSSTAGEPRKRHTGSCWTR